jgi:hypothetical protein
MFAVPGLVGYSLLLIQKQDEDVKQCYLRRTILIVDHEPDITSPSLRFASTPIRASSASSSPCFFSSFIVSIEKSASSKIKRRPGPKTSFRCMCIILKSPFPILVYYLEVYYILPRFYLALTLILHL